MEGVIEKQKAGRKRERERETERERRYGRGDDDTRSLGTQKESKALSVLFTVQLFVCFITATR